VFLTLADDVIENKFKNKFEETINLEDLREYTVFFEEKTVDYFWKQNKY